MQSTLISEEICNLIDPISPLLIVLIYLIVFVIANSPNKICQIFIKHSFEVSLDLLQSHSVLEHLYIYAIRIVIRTLSPGLMRDIFEFKGLVFSPNYTEKS